MRWREINVPAPGPGEARLRQTAIGVNYIDVYARTGLYPLITPPGVPGMEAAGEVIDIGAGVTGIMPGDRVAYACTPAGAYTQYRTLDAQQLVVLPADIGDETAAALMLKGMSAEFLVRRVVRVQHGDTVLVHAAAGGVGLLLCQWAKHLGATVIGTVSTEAKARAARAAGCDHPIITTQEDFVAHTRRITGGRGANIVYDSVGKDTLARSLEALAAPGHLVSYGQASGAPEPPPLATLSARSTTFSRPVLFHYTSDPAVLREMASNVFALVTRGCCGSRSAIAIRSPRLRARIAILKRDGRSGRACWCRDIQRHRLEDDAKVTVMRSDHRLPRHRRRDPSWGRRRCLRGGHRMPTARACPSRAKAWRRPGVPRP